MKINNETKPVLEFCAHFKFLIKTQTKTSTCVAGRIFLLFILVCMYFCIARLAKTMTETAETLIDKLKIKILGKNKANGSRAVTESEPPAHLRWAAATSSIIKVAKSIVTLHF